MSHTHHHPTPLQSYAARIEFNCWESTWKMNSNMNWNMKHESCWVDMKHEFMLSPSYVYIYIYNAIIRNSCFMFQFMSHGNLPYDGECATWIQISVWWRSAELPVYIGAEAAYLSTKNRTPMMSAASLLASSCARDCARVASTVCRWWRASWVPRYFVVGSRLLR